MSKIKDSSWKWTSLTFSTGARSEDIEEKFFYLKSASSTRRMLTQNRCSFEEVSTRMRWRLIMSKAEIDLSWRRWKNCWLKSSSLRTLRRRSNGINWYQLCWQMRIKFIALIVSFRRKCRFSCDKMNLYERLLFFADNHKKLSNQSFNHSLKSSMKKINIRRWWKNATSHIF